MEGVVPKPRILLWVRLSDDPFRCSVPVVQDYLDVLQTLIAYTVNSKKLFVFFVREQREYMQRLAELISSMQTDVDRHNFELFWNDKIEQGEEVGPGKK